MEWSTEQVYDDTFEAGGLSDHLRHCIYHKAQDHLPLHQGEVILHLPGTPEMTWALLSRSNTALPHNKGA